MSRLNRSRMTRSRRSQFPQPSLIQINKLRPNLKTLGGEVFFPCDKHGGEEEQMSEDFLRIIFLVFACVAAFVSSASAADRPQMQEVREETWALMTPLPVFAYVVRPVGGGPYPLLIMNHGISGDPQQRGFFPFVEFRDAANWFARRGYFVVSPVRYGGVSIDRPEQDCLVSTSLALGIVTSPTSAGRG
jgi:hypothetical protein